MLRRSVPLRRLPAPLRAFVHVALPVFAGGMLYLAFRSPAHLLFRWAEQLGALGAVIDLRQWAAGFAPLPSWVRYSLPDGLWLYSFAFLMLWLWRDADREAALWRWLPLGLALGSEAAQAARWLPGTFDGLDVVTYLAAYALAFAITRAPSQTAAQRVVAA